MTMYDRIRQRRLELGMTQKELADKLGYKNKTAITKIEAGKVDLTQTKIYAFAQALQTNVDYLMGDVKRAPAGLVIPEFHQVPIIGTIACGTPILAEENLDGFAKVTDLVCDFGLWCKGDSMAPRFLDGDLVFIRQQPDVDNGQIAAVLIENEATLKHVYKQPDRLTLIAENPSFPPLIYTDPVELQQIRIIGLVTGYQRAVNQ